MKLLRKNRKGFTLVEVIVVLVILGILLAIAVPNVIAYIDKANEKADVLAARSVYLGAVTEAAEEYGKDTSKAVAVTSEAFLASVKDLAGLPTSATISVSLVEDSKNKIDFVTYVGAKGTVKYESTGKYEYQTGE